MIVWLSGLVLVFVFWIAYLRWLRSKNARREAEHEVQARRRARLRRGRAGVPAGGSTPDEPPPSA